MKRMTQDGIGLLIVDKEYKTIGNPACLKGGRILTFLAATRNDKLSFDLLIQRELHSGNEKVEPIPFEAYTFAIDERENLWFLGKDGAEVVLYIKAATNGFTQVSIFKSEKRITPYHVNVFDNTITVIVRESEDKKETTQTFPVGNNTVYIVV